MTSNSSAADPSAPDDLVIEGDVGHALAGDATPESLLATCRAVTERFVEARLKELFEAAREKLFAQAREAHSNDVQQDCFDAMQELHRIQPTIERSFDDALEQDFERLWSAELLASTRDDSPGEDGEMSLVDTQSFDDSVRLMGVIAKAAPGLKGAESELCARLASLLPVPVEEDLNPVTLERMCHSFHVALQNLGAQRPTRRALLDGLANTLVARLDELHEELNGLLADADVLPDAPQMARTPQRPCHPERKGDEAARAPAETDEAPPSTAGSIAPVRDLPERHRQPAAPPGDPGISFGDAVASVHHLAALGRAVAGAGQAVSPGPAPAPNPTVRQIVDHALADLQMTREAETWGEKGPFALASRLSGALENYSVKLNDPATVDMVELVSGLFDAILADPLVERRAKPGIRKIAVPVLRVALADGSFFASDVHPARATINALGLLGVDLQSTVSDEDGLGDRAARALGAVLQSRDVSREVFSHAASELEALVSIQGSIQAQSTAELVKRLEQRQDQRPRQAGGEARPAHGSSMTGAHAVMARLEPGDWVVMRPANGSARRAMLAWRGPERSRYAFVDALGRELATLEAAELARELDDARTQVADTARMPVVDRAMCGVLQGMHQGLERKATRDPLTGVATLGRLEKEMTQVLEHAARPKTHHHLCCVEIDTLPGIVERCGQDASDSLLKQYAAVLKRQIGDSGLVARSGPARFVALLPGKRRAEVLELVERHRRSLEVASCSYRGERLPLGVSIGVIALADGMQDVGVALERAEDANRAAKVERGNGLHFVESQIDADLPGNAGTESPRSILDFIASDDLALRCQLIEPLGDSGQAYHEVLLGLRNADGTLSPPGEVVLAAERSGEVIELDRWVVRAALAWMGEHPEWLGTVDGLSINLSGKTLCDVDLAREVGAMLDETGVPPAKVMFEITESTGIDQLSVAQGFIEALRARGCRFALDDFGAGHASFSHLKLLPVDTVKIDGLFVRDIVTNSSDEAMVRSINEIAKLLGKRTVAEFAEDDAAIELLRAIGVDYAQGYGVGKPIPLTELASAPLAPAPRSVAM
jgi:diguanylate cyclase (GGDEF)-like protein